MHYTARLAACTEGRAGISKGLVHFQVILCVAQHTLHYRVRDRVHEQSAAFVGTVLKNRCPALATAFNDSFSRENENWNFAF